MRIVEVLIVQIALNSNPDDITIEYITRVCYLPLSRCKRG